MKKYFYIGLIGLAIFEILNVYFIMPMPGSQRMNSLDFAYFLYTYRWLFRVVFVLVMVLGVRSAFSTRKWIPIIASIPVVALVIMFNFKMTAERMFEMPKNLSFISQQESTLPDSTIVLVVSNDKEAKAYPLRYIVYHHQVRDTLGTEAIMVTYCSVCRTGRAFYPTVNGKPEVFRLVGMDHFNAMFEDKTTRSWWRQVNGEAVTGSLKGTLLPELPSDQMTLRQFFTLYPTGLLMQPDAAYTMKYDSLGKFEHGKSRSKLTGSDSLSWQEKSWVVGVLHGDQSKAYDWNDLKKARIIHDTINGVPIVVVLSADNMSFAAFERTDINQQLEIQADSLISVNHRYDFAGRSVHGSSLKKVAAYQEFWHSWRTFHPKTTQYGLP